MNSVFPRRARKEFAPSVEPAPSGEHGGALLGRLLLEAGKLTEIDVNRVVVVQRKKNLRFGEAARRLVLVTEEDVAHTLALQFSYPYVTGEAGAVPTMRA